MTDGIVAEQDGKTPVARSLRIIKDPVKVPLREQAVLAPEGSGGLLGFVHFPECGQWRPNTPVVVTGPTAIGTLRLAVRLTGVSGPWHDGV
ncbi:MAG: hypothetical protein QNJ73_05145 [Gammaproteobacteria bacterium]|nr:hypothetical protein [Gammaproteobacteria bacterium]